MLKVVGASWEKTRFSTIMLATVSIIAIFAIFFFEIPLYHNDGNYAATVYWSKTVGFRVEFWRQSNDPEYIKTGVARAYYRPDMSETGWASLEIETQHNYPDWVQAHAAGLLEGSLCWQLIYWHWQNTVAYVCEGQTKFCEEARKYLAENSETIKKEAAVKDSIDPEWHQVNLFYHQLEGLEYGWKYGVTRSRKNKIIDIPETDFLWMNAICDLRDLEKKYNITTDVNSGRPPLSLALLKLLPDTEIKYLLAHASAGFYSEMLRMQKKYTFRFHRTGDNKSGLVPGQDIRFTSYPAAIHSQDDFYHINRTEKLVVSGTALRNYNPSLWDKADVNKLLMGPRVMVANRLASNASDWAKLMKFSNGGTGNKQWLVINPNQKDIQVWVVEQLPGVTLAQDKSHIANNQGYLALYGLPHDPVLLDLIKYPDVSQDKGNCHYYRSLQHSLDRAQSNITDVNSLIQLMRSPQLTIMGRKDLTPIIHLNFYQNYFNISDQLFQVMSESSKACNFTYFLDAIKKANLSKEIESLINGNFLLDLHVQRNLTPNTNEVSGEEKKSVKFYDNIRKIVDMDHSTIEYPLSQVNPSHLTDSALLKQLAGNIDVKVSTAQGHFKAIAGPPFTDGKSNLRIEPFQWSRSMFKHVPHHGQADVWKFGLAEPKWVWK